MATGDPKDQETKQVLAQAATEIRQLRSINQVLQARTDTLDLLAAFLFAKPQEHHGVGMAEDIAWRIDKLLQSKD